MRFLHPGDTTGRWSPGSSRRRRERERALESTRAAATIDEELQPWDWWGAPGRILAAEPCEARPHTETQTDGALKVAQGCGYDPGNAAYRFHTAINETTKHASAFIRYDHTNPFCDLRQIDGLADRRGVCKESRRIVYEADVLHSHVDYLMQGKAGFRNRWKARDDQLVIRHYHGTRWDKPIEQQWPRLCMLEDDIAGATLVGARLTLCAVRPSRFQWLPIAVPVKRYRNMVPRVRRPGPFRIAHSPTVNKYKGTEDLIAAVETLRGKGLKIDLILIEGQQHGKALEMKADCDMTFDSFWLGIQGSGLEAGAMGQMVVAGDQSVVSLYEQSEVGECPYTFAGDRSQLTEVLERAITDSKYWRTEALRVTRYVREFHDYAAVAKRYEGIIAKATGWQNVSTKKRGRAA